MKKTKKIKFNRHTSLYISRYAEIKKFKLNEQSKRPLNIVGIIIRLEKFNNVTLTKIKLKSGIRIYCRAAKPKQQLKTSWKLLCVTRKCGDPWRTYSQKRIRL